MADKIIAIRVRGSVGVKKEMEDTMAMLNLRNQHNCVVIPATPVYIGMLKKVQGYITYGIANEDTIKLIEAKRKGDEKCVRLAPPRKGFERKGIKTFFTQGGALGDRKEAINELVARMV